MSSFSEYYEKWKKKNNIENEQTYRNITEEERTILNNDYIEKTFDNILPTNNNKQYQKVNTGNTNKSLWDNILDIMNGTGKAVENTWLGFNNGIKSFQQTLGKRMTETQQNRVDFWNEENKKMLEQRAKTHPEEENQIKQAINNPLITGEQLKEGEKNASEKIQNKKEQNLQKINQNIEEIDNPVMQKIAEISPSIGQMIPAFATGGIGAVYMAGSSTGQYYDDAKQRGMNDEEAKTYSGIMGLMEGATEMIGINNLSKAGKGLKELVKGTGKEVAKETAEKVSKATVKEVLKDYGIGIADNMIQEALIDPIQEFTAQTVAGKDKAQWNGLGNRMLQDAINGGLVGAILGGANLGIQSCTGLVQKYNSNQKITSEEFKTAVKDASKELDTGEMIKQNIQQEVNKYNLQNENVQNNIVNTKGMTFEESASANNIDINNETIKTVNQALSNRDIAGRFDSSYFKNSNENAIWRTYKDEEGNIKREVIFNPNGDSQSTMQQISIHELTHDLVGTKEYEELKNLVLDKNKTRQGYKEARQSLESTYSQVYDSNSENFKSLVDDEEVADTLAQKLGDQDFINSLNVEKPNVFKRIYNWVVDKVNKITGNKIEKLYWEDIKNKFENAYSQEYKGTESQEKFSFVGQKGIKNAVQQEPVKYISVERKLNKAKQMQQTGIDNESIRRNTGWFQDKNGDWKFEISDKNMKIKKNVKLKENTSYKLGEIIEHDTLFTMYPALKNIDVEFTNMKGIYGNYNIKKNKIKLNNSLANNNKQIESTLIHEMQHTIQDIEGFELGASSKISKKAYFESLGEIEADNTKQRFIKEKYKNIDIGKIAPESSKANPKHRGYNNYMENRGTIDKLKDTMFKYPKKGGNSNEFNQESLERNSNENLQEIRRETWNSGNTGFQRHRGNGERNGRGKQEIGSLIDKTVQAIKEIEQENNIVLSEMQKIAKTKGYGSKTSEYTYKNIESDEYKNKYEKIHENKVKLTEAKNEYEKLIMKKVNKNIGDRQGFYEIQKDVDDQIILFLIEQAENGNIFFRYQDSDIPLRKGQKSWNAGYDKNEVENAKNVEFGNTMKIEKGKSAMDNPILLVERYKDWNELVVAFFGDYIEQGIDGEDIASYRKKAATYKAKDFEDYFESITNKLYDAGIINPTLYDIEEFIINKLNKSKKYSTKAENGWENFLETQIGPTGKGKTVQELRLPTKENAEIIENRKKINQHNKEKLEKVGITKDNDIITNKENFNEKVEEEKIANILEEMPTKEKEKSRAWAIFKANVFDKGIVFEELSRKTKNRELQGKWDYTLTANARGQNAIGMSRYEFDSKTKTQKLVSKSLESIREEVGENKTEFNNYMYHQLNIDRMTLEERFGGDTGINYERKNPIENKPVFSKEVTAKMSQEIVDKYEQSNPEFKEWAKDVYDFLDANTQELVKSGVISENTRQVFKEMYPHYVPIARVNNKGNEIAVPLDTGRTGVNSPIKKAKCGNQDILPLFETIASRTLQTYRASARNNFGVELLNTLQTVQTSENTDVDNVVEEITNSESEELLEKGNKTTPPTFTVFENGEKVTFEISKDMYDALKPVGEGLTYKNKALNKISNFRRGVLTEYNPIFMITNSLKDIQDVIINSQHISKTISKLPEAYSQILKKGYWYNEYIQNGGEQNSYFNANDGSFENDKKVSMGKNIATMPLRLISKVNNIIEMSPRLAEYIASREKGMGIETAMLDASRVTTNFKAGGNVTKFLNRNGATFLNASVQGAMQQIRNIQEAKVKGLKGWTVLACKYAVAGLPVILLNNILWGDDEDYEELQDYVKDNYYCVAKYGDGKFIRIPKGRTTATIQKVVSNVSEYLTKNKEINIDNLAKDFWEDLQFSMDNLAPNNPIDNNIISPIIQTVTNTSWYGEDIVPSRLQDKPKEEQYDESTDKFSKWLGEKLKISPYKINYLLDQYGGGISDVVLPALTPQAENNMMEDKFTTDSVMKSKYPSDFFEKSNEINVKANSDKATDLDKVKGKYLTQISEEMNKLYKEKRKIQNSDVEDNIKKDKLKTVQKEINKLARKGMEEVDKAEIKGITAKVDDELYYKYHGEWTKLDEKEKKKTKNISLESYADFKNKIYEETKRQKDSGELEKDKELKNTTKSKILLNSDYSNKDKLELYRNYISSTDKKIIVVDKLGLPINQYLKYKSQEFESDKDEDGETVKGSKNQKVYDYLNAIPDSKLSQDYKKIICKMEGINKYDHDIVNNINKNSKLSPKDRVEILTNIGFKIDKNGRIKTKSIIPITKYVK